MVDDEVLNGASATFDLEAEAVHRAEDGGDTVVILRIIGRQIVVVGARDSGLVEDGKLKIVTQSNGKIVGRCVGALRFPVPRCHPWVRVRWRGDRQPGLSAT